MPVATSYSSEGGHDVEPSGSSQQPVVTVTIKQTAAELWLPGTCEATHHATDGLMANRPDNGIGFLVCMHYWASGACVQCAMHVARR